MPRVGHLPRRFIAGYRLPRVEEMPAGRLPWGRLQVPTAVPEQ